MANEEGIGGLTGEELALETKQLRADLAFYARGPVRIQLVEGEHVAFTYGTSDKLHAVNIVMNPSFIKNIRNKERARLIWRGIGFHELAHHIWSAEEQYKVAIEEGFKPLYNLMDDEQNERRGQAQDPNWGACFQTTCAHLFPTDKCGKNTGLSTGLPHDDGDSKEKPKGVQDSDLYSRRWSEFAYHLRRHIPDASDPCVIEALGLIPRRYMDLSKDELLVLARQIHHILARGADVPEGSPAGEAGQPEKGGKQQPDGQPLPTVKKKSIAMRLLQSKWSYVALFLFIVLWSSLFFKAGGLEIWRHIFVWVVRGLGVAFLFFLLRMAARRWLKNLRLPRGGRSGLTRKWPPWLEYFIPWRMPPVVLKALGALSILALIGSVVTYFWGGSMGMPSWIVLWAIKFGVGALCLLGGSLVFHWLAMRRMRVSGGEVAQEGAKNGLLAMLLLALLMPLKLLWRLLKLIGRGLRALLKWVGTGIGIAIKAVGKLFAKLWKYRTFRILAVAAPLAALLLGLLAEGLHIGSYNPKLLIILIILLILALLLLLAFRKQLAKLLIGELTMDQEELMGGQHLELDDEIEFRLIPNIEPVNPDQKFLEAIMPQVYPLAQLLRPLLLKCGQKNTDKEDMHEGHDLVDELEQASFGETALFIDEEENPKTSLHIEVAVDCSSSMYMATGALKEGEKFLLAKIFALVVEEAVRNQPGITAHFWGFTDSAIYDCGVPGQKRVSGLLCQGGNNDAAMLWHMGQSAARSTAAVKMLFMVSDSQPADCSFASLRHLVRRFEADGMIPWNFCLEKVTEQAFERYFTDLTGKELQEAILTMGSVIAALAGN